MKRNFLGQMIAFIIVITYALSGFAFEQTHKEIKKGVYTFRNEPKGFREMLWGTPMEIFLKRHSKASEVDLLSSLKEEIKEYHKRKETIRFVEEVNFFRQIYVVNDGKENIIGWPTKVFYGFFDDKLDSAFMVVEEKVNLKGFEAVVMARYGKPIEVEPYYPKYMDQINERSVGIKMWWLGSITQITWTKYTAIDQLYNEERDYGFLKIESREGIKVRVKAMQKVTDVFQKMMKKDTDKDF